MEDKEKILLEVIAKIGKAVRHGDIAKTTSLESEKVSKIIKDLKKKGKVISPKRCYYSIAQ